MKEYGQFDVPDNTHVEIEFPCSKCGHIVKGKFPIKSDSHDDVTMICESCAKSYDVVIMHDAGTGTVVVSALGQDQKAVKAQGVKK
jgi:transcription elongation factor Elf1